MTSEYDAHTAVTRTGEGRYEAVLHDGWRVGGGLNGGYLLGVVGRAIGAQLTEAPDPVSVSAYYLSGSVAGPATVDVRVIRQGGSLTTVAAELAQGEESRLSVLASFGRLADLGEGVATSAEEPQLAPLERCVSNQLAPAELRAIAPLMDRFEMLFDPDSIGWALGEPSGRGVLEAWFRLSEDRDPDPLSLLTVADVLPPVTFDLGRFGWAPTIELTVHVRAIPAPGWLKVRHGTRNVAGGMFEEDCEIWDSAGRLVAQSRQLARLPR